MADTQIIRINRRNRTSTHGGGKWRRAQVESIDPTSAFRDPKQAGGR